MDLVSVIIPYYKKKDFISETIDSVLKQTYNNLEIIIIYDDKQYAQTHSIARLCAIESGLYANDKLKAIVIDQVLDWANEITNKIAPSIRAAMRDKDLEKSKRLREEFIKNDLLIIRKKRSSGILNYVKMAARGCGTTRKRPETNA